MEFRLHKYRRRTGDTCDKVDSKLSHGPAPHQGRIQGQDEGQLTTVNQMSTGMPESKTLSPVRQPPGDPQHPNNKVRITVQTGLPGTEVTWAGAQPTAVGGCSSSVGVRITLIGWQRDSNCVLRRSLKGALTWGAASVRPMLVGAANCHQLGASGVGWHCGRKNLSLKGRPDPGIVGDGFLFFFLLLQLRLPLQLRECLCEHAGPQDPLRRQGTLEDVAKAPHVA